jgi:thiol-disulfide isomerase/thioredoxin
MPARFYITCLALLVPALISSQARTHDQAPEIRLDATIPNTVLKQGEMSELKGKAVVLEFWATWCAPCIAAIPHWNELVAQFKNRPVEFVSITDEKQDTVRTFLPKRPIDGWIGFDYNRQMFDAYAVDGIPQTVLIDPKGKVAGVTRPDLINSERIEELLEGRT